MTFLQPWLLFALPLALTPIVVHLLNRQRYQRVEWGAMRFLLQANRQRRGRKRLRHLLILLSRMIAVVALVFIISRPMTGRWFAWFTDQPETVLIVLDRSPSMADQDIQSGVSNRSRAIDQLVGAIRQVGQPRHLVLIDSSGRQPLRLSSIDELKHAARTTPIDAAANLPAMLEQALQFVVSNRTGRTDVWICSDLQRSNWQPQNERWQTLRTGFADQLNPICFHLLNYAAGPLNRSANIGIRIDALRRESLEESDQLRMDIRLLRDGDQRVAWRDQTVHVAVVVDGARSVVDVPLARESAELQNHVVPLAGNQRRGWGKVELPADRNLRDNVFFFAYGTHRARKIVVVSDQPDQAWSLRLAAAPKPEVRESVSLIDPDVAASWDWRDRSLALCIWQAPLPHAAVQRHLELFVDNGGQIIFLPPPVDATARDSDRTVWGHRWQDWVLDAASASLAANSVDHWRDDSGLWAHADSGQPLPVPRLRVSNYCRLAGDGQVLARLSTGDPLLVRAVTQYGGVHFLATWPQMPHSNLAQEGVVLYAMVQRALQAGAQRSLADHLGEIQMLDINRYTVAELANWQQLEGWPEGRSSTEKPLVAGVYSQGDRIFARNRPALEDERGSVTKQQLERMFAGLNFRTLEDSVQNGRALVAEIWRVFAGLMLLALIVEAVLCLPDIRSKRWVSA